MRKRLLFILVAISLLIIFIFIKFSPHTSADSAFVKITGEVVNVRVKPDTSHKVITQINKGETYPLENEQDDWYEIRLPSGKKGWIANWLGTKQSSNSSSKLKGIVTVNDLNVRSEPSLSGSILGKLHNGHEVQILEKVNDWTRIAYQEEDAWISSKYVDMIKEDDKSIVSDGEFIKTLHSGTNIRKKPTLKSNIVGQAASGEIFKVIDKTGDWYKVQVDSNKTGFIASWIVSNTTSIPKSTSGQKGLPGKIIVIDPGHGGRDQGAKGTTGTLEKDITLSTAELLITQLEAAGAYVIQTRKTDEYTSLERRTDMAMQNSADAFISLHYDSITDESVHGHTSYYYSNSDKILAESIHHQIVSAVNLKDRGVRHGNYFVLRENHQLSVLLELGYLSNPNEEGVIKTRKYQEKVANAIFKGLEDYFLK